MRLFIAKRSDVSTDVHNTLAYNNAPVVVAPRHGGVQVGYEVSTSPWRWVGASTMGTAAIYSVMVGSLDPAALPAYIAGGTLLTATLLLQASGRMVIRGIGRPLRGKVRAFPDG